MTEKIKLTFLGTGDSVPSAKRNHLSILFTYKKENILIDCGEGTQRQFRKAKLNPCKVTRILISHWHADHILGIPGLLKTLSFSGYNKTLFIYGPVGIKNFMNRLLTLFEFKGDFPIEIKEVSGKFFENEDIYFKAEKMTHGIHCNAYSFVIKGKKRINKEKLQKLKISEGPHLKRLKKGKDIFYNGKKYLAKNLIYEDKSRKVSFVIDTKFNNKIVPFVKNSCVLVCESTFSSEFKNKAKEYNHLTSEQAAKIAKKSKSKKLFLVHVSQRFSKDLKKVLKEAREVFKESYLPKDLDVIEI